MAGLPIAATAFSGFGVVRRSPLAVLVWGLVLFVLTVLPLFAMFAVLAPVFEELIRSFTNEAASEDAAFKQLMALQARSAALNPLTMVASLVARVLLTCAIFRAVLRPQDKAFAYLRLGKTELLVGLVYVCLMIVLFILVFFGLGLVIVAVALTAMSSEVTAATIAVVGGLVLVAFFVWLWLRFSMALPMTFAQNEFRLFESWSLTRGHAMRLLAISLIVMVAILAIEGLLAAVVIGVLAAVFASGPPDEAVFTAFFSRPLGVWAAELAPWAAGIGLVGSILGAFLSTLMTAPWAAAWQALAPAPVAEEAPAA